MQIHLNINWYTHKEVARDAIHANIRVLGSQTPLYGSANAQQLLISAAEDQPRVTGETHAFFPTSPVSLVYPTLFTLIIWKVDYSGWVQSNGYMNVYNYTRQNDDKHNRRLSRPHKAVVSILLRCTFSVPNLTIRTGIALPSCRFNYINWNQADICDLFRCGLKMWQATLRRSLDEFL